VGTEPGEVTARGEIVPGEGGEDDPRVLLRAQLRRSLSNTHPTPSSSKVSKVGSDLKGKGRAAPEGGDGIVELEAGAESEEAEAIVSRSFPPLSPPGVLLDFGERCPDLSLCDFTS
jgi:hypothetical protein